MQNTVILTVHNKEETITKILKNLIENLSKYTSKIIIILDGCTDKTSKNINQFIYIYNPEVEIEIIISNDIWETKANNLGLREVKTKFATIVQDDMLIRQKNWDETLLKNFKKFKLFAVSGRAGHEFSLINNKFKVVNLFGREYPFSSNSLLGKFIGKFISIFKPYWIYKYINFFSRRIVVNRGPLIIDMLIARKLDFFDEKFAPFELDDVDLCCRAYKKFGLLSGANPIFYSELNGSKKNSLESAKESQKSIIKNTKIIIERHSDLAI